MLFDLYDVPKEIEYEHWVRRVHVVARTLGYDYFKLWNLPELEFTILENLAYEELENRKKKIDEVKEGQ